ncbi:hypothetical protein [Ruegeria sp. Ofav3-42]|uniref:hypothetical protein n=1 Tax=Ruegeria sp. Ofav3-42 TaxID=2917759 RepID=UPI001EF6749C|nr:hypothetical protein [Ruegeria sp. Ofav3-42]MCG7518731.1 hypothetical protein [Ruegeria sp. Ofav3-42]
MVNRVKILLKDEDGAVTVDWVVLTAALVGIAVFIGLYFAEPVREIDAAVGTSLTKVSDNVQEITVDFSQPGS